jgi:hypothetical protein
MANLDSLLKKAASTRARQCQDLLALLDVPSLIDSCLGEPHQTLAEIAADSYRHANGFDKISFPGINNIPVRLRLHIWRGASTGNGSDVDPHNHRWPFASRVLVGDLTNTLYITQQHQAGDYMRYKHSPLKSNLGYELSRVDRAYLRCTDVFHTITDQTYELTADAIHAVTTPNSVYTATIVLELASSKEFSDMFVRSGSKPTDTAIIPIRFQVPELRQHLIDLRGRL